MNERSWKYYLAKDCTKPQYSPAMNNGPHEQALPKH